MKKALISTLTGYGAIKASVPQGCFAESTEDVVLNIKSMAVRRMSQECVSVFSSLDKDTIRASDLTSEYGYDIEFADPDHVIAHVVNKDSKKEIRIVFEKGCGYKVIPEKEKELISSCQFTPVEFAEITVEDTRVGSDTGLNKLLLEVKTNGAISAIEAVRRASMYVRGTIECILALDPKYSSRTDFSDIVVEEYEKEHEADEKPLGVKIEELGLPIRVCNVLHRNNINTVEEVVSAGAKKIKNFRNFGEKAMDDLKAVLLQNGIKFE